MASLLVHNCRSVDMNKKEKKQYINVFVRVRPLNQNEGVKNCIEIHGSKELKIKTHNSKNYTFDRVFHEGCGQLDVYLTVAEPIVNEVISGYNCTILAYGQTGTGKTYTMTGGAPESEEAPTLSWEQDKHAGIIPRTLAHMFNALRAQQLEYTVRVSYLELYNEEIFDLLSPLDDHSKLKLYDDSLKKGSVIVQGLSEVTVNSKQEVYNILEKGADKRRIAATLMNANSSRSHTVFCITVHTKENSVDGEDLLKTGKLYLVDLAGSENIKQSGATDIRARETFSINQSLLTLGRCINKLTEKAMHVPYRESKLTRLLQDSLGGRTKTTLIATISPSYINLDETINTLEYANRAKHITNKPEVNQRLSKNALIKEYTEEIDRLRKDLLAARSGTGFYCNKENYEELERDLVKHQALVTDKIGMIKVLQEEMAHKEHALFAVKMSLSEEQEQKRILVSDLEKKLEEAINKIGTLTEANSIKEFMLEVNHTTENELKTTAKELLKVADTSVTDNERLHIKMENIIDIHDKNKIMYDQCLGDFNAQFSEIKNRMDTLKLHESECEGKLSDSLKGLSNIKQRYDKLNADMKAEIELLRTTVTSSTEEIDDSKTTFDKELSDAAKDLIRQVQDNDKSVTNTVYKKLIPYLTAANQEVNEINSYSKSVIDGVQVTVTEHFDQARRLLSNLRIIMEKSQDSVINFLDSKYSLADDFCYAAQKRQKEVILKKQNQLQFEIESSISQLNNLKRQLIKTKNITFDFTQDVHSHEEMHANNYLEFKSNFAENKDLVANLMEQTTSTLTAYEKEINCFSSLHHERVNKAIDYLQDKKTDIHNNFVNAQGKLITCIESDVHKQNEELRNKITSHLLKNQKKLNDITIAQLNNFSEIEKIGEDFSKKTELVTQDLHSNVMNQEKELGATMDTMKSVMSDFSSDTLTNLEYCRAKYKELYTDKLFKTYQETGLTPARKQYKYPRTIPDTLSFDKLLEKYEETKKSRSDEMKSSELEDNDHMTPSKPSMLKMRRSISENNLQSINSEDISPTKVPLSEMTVKSKNVDVKCLIPRFGENLKKKD